MTSTFLWALVPVIVGAALLFYRRNDGVTTYLAAAVSMFLTWVAWQIPVDIVMQLGPVSFEIAPTWVLFGRNFTLGEAERILLTLIYLAQSIWLLGALLTRPPRLFAPISMIAVGLFVAALSVEPFLYAALMLAAVVLIFVPVLVVPGQAAGRGLQRFLKFQMFAVPWILFTGWLLTGVETSPGNLNLILRAGLLLALGFAFLLALFPFHAWLPMLAKEANPYVFGFLVFFFPAISMVFALSFFDRYIWLRQNESVYQALFFSGGFNLLFSGLWAFRERSLARVFAFASMAAIGGLLQAIGLGGSAGVQAFFALLLPQCLVLWGFAVCLGIFWREAGSLELADLHRSLRLHPLLTLAMLASLFAIAGFPFFGPFSAHLAIWQGLGQRSIPLLVASLIGSLGLMAAGFRILKLWIAPIAKSTPVLPLRKDEIGRPIQPVGDMASPYTWVVFSIWAVVLLGFGLLPRFFLGPVPSLAAMFPQLFP